MLDNARRHSFKRGDLEISYLEWNNSHQSDRPKQPLLLLHGLADCAVVWSNLGEYLAEEYHIVAPDLRGHGESSKPSSEADYSSEAMIADLVGLMGHLGWEKTHLLGHSWGAKVAAIWASADPGRFLSLILVDPFYIDRFPSWTKFTFPFFYRVLPFLQAMGPFPSQSAAIAIARQLKQYRQWTEFQQQVFNATIEVKPDGTWGSKFTVAARNGIFTDVMQKSGLTKTLNLPSLLIKPTKGLNRSQWQLKPYRRYLPNLEIQEVEGNHWVFLVNPNEFNVAISEFLRS